MASSNKNTSRELINYKIPERTTPENIIQLNITTMKKIITSIALLFAAGFVNQAEAQSVAINSTGNVADTSALLDLTSTAKGILVPRMTSTQRAAIYQPATGLMVFQTDAPAGFYYNSGTSASPVWNLLQTSLANVTTQGNTFNGASQLVQMTAATKLPAVDGSLLTNLTATNLSSGTVPDARLSSNVTLQGNSFNGASQLVKLDGSSKLPAVDGSNLTNLPAGSTPVTVVSASSNGSYTVTASSTRIYVFNFSASAPATFTVTLPAASAYSSGTVLRFSCVNITAAPQHFTFASSSNIYATTITTSADLLTANFGTTFITDGTNWYRL